VGCRFVPRATRFQSPTSPPVEIVAQLWFADTIAQASAACPRGTRHQQRGDDGMGEPAAKLFGAVPALRVMSTTTVTVWSRRRVTVSTSAWCR